MSQSPAPNPFANAVQRAAQPPAAAGLYQQMVRVLDSFSQAVEQFPGGTLRCTRIPGFITNLGQEYRIVVHSTTKGMDHLLLRAHIPPAGTPVMLDLYDEDLIECDQPNDVQQQLLQFLDRNTTVDALRTLAAP